jgi:ATP-dependent helicase/nuclease subunit A
VGTTNHKSDDARWPGDLKTPLTPAQLAARSHLDLIASWLPSVTRDEDWSSKRSGANGLLRWEIYDGDNVAFAHEEKKSAADESETVTPDAGALAALKARLDWNYPFTAATTEAAKSSVTAIRRRAADEADDEAKKEFQVSSFKFSARRKRDGKLSAAQTGTAHHTFLQLVALGRTGSLASLRDEAARLQREGALTTEEAGALDFSALEKFWRSDIGAKLRALPEGAVNREMPFTARFSAGELQKLTHAATMAGAPDDFVVVQGAVDLAVILSGEIWLLDFKTDDVDERGLPDKVRHYAPQLQTYALALERIYRKPVTNRWLHFLAAGKTETVGA